LAVAALEPVGHIAAATMLCMRLYDYLGQQLAAQTKPASSYREWVMTYSSTQFEAQALCLEVLRTATRAITIAWRSCITRRWSSNCGSSTLAAGPLTSKSPRATTLLPRHRDGEPILGFDEVILAVVADVDLDPGGGIKAKAEFSVHNSHSACA
jgi:hypothetical protein